MTKKPSDPQAPYPSWTVGLLILTCVFLGVSIVPFPQTANVALGIIGLFIGLVTLILNLQGRRK